MKKYCILGTDNRNVNLRNLYKEAGAAVTENFKEADVVIAPTPFSKDDIKINGEFIKCSELIEAINGKTLYAGFISSNMKEKLKEKNVKYYDLLENEGLAILNAIPTAEGAIEAAMASTNITLHGSNCLILGYGRIGKILSHMLFGLGAKVFCEARNKKDIAMIEAMGYNSVELEKLEHYLPNADIIFNTIPSLILDETRINMVKKEVFIIDLASAPGGVDFNYAKERKLNVKWLLALPTKSAPLTAARYYKEIIDRCEKGG